MKKGAKGKFSPFKEHLLKLLAISFLFLTSCQKKEGKESFRCIYDQPVFATMTLQAVHDEEMFSHFKQDPFFNLLWENLPPEEGHAWLLKIKEQFPYLIEKFNTFRENDKIGAPRVYPFEEIGLFSPTTLRTVAIAGDIHQKIGDLSHLRIVQIGAGCGSLCKILKDISGFDTYILVDLPEQLSLAKKCLTHWGIIERVLFITPEELPQKVPCDLVISDWSFSEFNRSYQKRFCDRIFSHSRSGYLLGHIFPKHYGVVTWKVEELKEKLKKTGNFSVWEIQEPSNDQENYFIYWKRIDIQKEKQ